MNKKVIPNQQLFDLVENIIRSGDSVELKIKGSSMYPFLINNQHRVVLIPYKREYLHTGNILLFAYNGKYLLHRLVTIDGESLILRGDNMPHKKEIIQEENIIACAKYIITPKGKTIDCINRRPGLKWHLWICFCKSRFNLGRLITICKNALKTA